MGSLTPWRDGRQNHSGCTRLLEFCFPNGMQGDSSFGRPRKDKTSGSVRAALV